MTNINLLEDVALASNSLGALTELGQRMYDLEKEIEQIEITLKKKKQEYKIISEEELPDLMSELNSQAFALGNGQGVYLHEFMSHSLPTKTAIVRQKDEGLKNELMVRRQKCFQWLRENQAESLIKNTVKINFDRKEDEQCRQFTKEISDRGINYSLEETVNSKTLSNHFDGMLKEGKELPTDLFKIYTGSVGKFCNADDVKKIIKKGKL